MTRLTSEDVRFMKEDLVSYDADLLRKTGLSLRQIACRAAGMEEAEARRSLPSIVAGVIPVTSGEGIIEGFCGAVADIVGYLGARSIITGSTDVAGLAEAVQRGADVLFLADDNRFIALNLSSRIAADNSEATARGYVAALDALAGGLSKRPVLVLGAGEVGRNAIVALLELGARAVVYDPDAEKIRALGCESDITVEKDLEDALQKHRLILDASPAAGIIKERHIKPNTTIAAPGLPLGLCPGALVSIGDRLIHDPLQIGVATMLVLAIQGERKEMRGG
ncbi:MAG: alanine dehydrogenase [Candidatus Aminicenantes bacterium]|nr:alanine dehydrogenase [Candidatus Aminicenantes bacterium]